MSISKRNVRTETVERWDEERSCDRCGEIIPRQRMGDFTRITIECEAGWSCGADGYDYTATITDACEACWPSIRGALEAAGLVFREERRAG